MHCDRAFNSCHRFDHEIISEILERPGGYFCRNPKTRSRIDDVGGRCIFRCGGSKVIVDDSLAVGILLSCDEVGIEDVTDASCQNHENDVGII